MIDSKVLLCKTLGFNAFSQPGIEPSGSQRVFYKEQHKLTARLSQNAYARLKLVQYSSEVLTESSHDD